MTTRPEQVALTVLPESENPDILFSFLLLKKLKYGWATEFSHKPFHHH